MTPPPAIGLVLDCKNPAALAEVWAAALDFVSQRGRLSRLSISSTARPMAPGQSS